MNRYFRPIISSIAGGVFIAIIIVLAGIQSSDFPLLFLTHGMAGFAGGYAVYFMFETTPSYTRRKILQGVARMREMYARSNDLDQISKMTALNQVEDLLTEIK